MHDNRDSFIQECSPNFLCFSDYHHEAADSAHSSLKPFYQYNYNVALGDYHQKNWELSRVINKDPGALTKKKEKIVGDMYC